PHFDRFSRFVYAFSVKHYGSSRGRFDSLFVQVQKRFVEDICYGEVIPWPARRDTVKVGAARRNVEGGFHTERLQCSAEREDRWLELEPRKGQRHVAPFPFDFSSEHVRGELL